MKIVKSNFNFVSQDRSDIFTIHVFFYKKPVKGHSTQSFLILIGF